MRTIVKLSTMEKAHFQVALIIIAVIKSFGFTVKLIGGAVRDFLTGRPVSDLDFSIVGMDQESIVRVGDKLKEVCSIDPAGLEFGHLKCIATSGCNTTRCRFSVHQPT